LWRSIEDGGYVPNRRYKAGKELYKEFESLPKWNYRKIKKAAGWTDLFAGNMVYFFSWFSDSTGKFCGMSVPVFDKNPKDYKWRPRKGMKEIKWSTYERRIKG